MALSEERFRQNPHYWPMYPQRITLAYTDAAFPPFRSRSSYTALFPLNSSLICLMVALIYNAVLLGRARGGSGPVAGFLFHHRNFLVASLFYGVILKLLRSNLIIAFNKEPEPNLFFQKRSDFVQALLSGSVTAITTQRLFIDTLLDPGPQYLNYSNAEFAMLKEAARLNPPILQTRVSLAHRLLQQTDQPHVLVGGDDLLMELRTRYCGLRFAFFDVSPPNSEGIFYGTKFKEKRRLTEAYATAVLSIKQRLSKKYEKRDCDGPPRFEKGILRFHGVQGIFVILFGIYMLGMLLVGVEWAQRRRHYWEVFTPEPLFRAPRFGPDEFLGFRPLPPRRNEHFFEISPGAGFF